MIKLFYLVIFFNFTFIFVMPSQQQVLTLNQKKRLVYLNCFLDDNIFNLIDEKLRDNFLSNNLGLSKNFYKDKIGSPFKTMLLYGNESLQDKINGVKDIIFENGDRDGIQNAFDNICKYYFLPLSDKNINFLVEKFPTKLCDSSLLGKLAFLAGWQNKEENRSLSTLSDEDSKNFFGRRQEVLRSLAAPIFYAYKEKDGLSAENTRKFRENIQKSTSLIKKYGLESDVGNWQEWLDAFENGEVTDEVFKGHRKKVNDILNLPLSEHESCRQESASLYNEMIEKRMYGSVSEFEDSIDKCIKNSSVKEKPKLGILKGLAYFSIEKEELKKVKNILHDEKILKEKSIKGFATYFLRELVDIFENPDKSLKESLNVFQESQLERNSSPKRAENVLVLPLNEKNLNKELSLNENLLGPSLSSSSKRKISEGDLEKKWEELKEGIKTFLKEKAEKGLTLDLVYDVKNDLEITQEKIKRISEYGKVYGQLSFLKSVLEEKKEDKKTSYIENWQTELDTISKLSPEKLEEEAKKWFRVYVSDFVDNSEKYIREPSVQEELDAFKKYKGGLFTRKTRSAPIEGISAQCSFLARFMRFYQGWSSYLKTPCFKEAFNKWSKRVLATAVLLYGIYKISPRVSRYLKKNFGDFPYPDYLKRNLNNFSYPRL